MTSPQYSSEKLAFQLRNKDISELFRFVLFHLHALAQAEQETPTTSTSTSFWPLGSYLFCSQEGAISVDNALSVVKMKHLMLITASPSSSIEEDACCAGVLNRVFGGFERDIKADGNTGILGMIYVVAHDRISIQIDR